MTLATPAQLAAALKTATANLFGGMEYLTPLACVKKHRVTKQPTTEIVPNGVLYKYTKTSVKTMQDYQQAVRNKAERQGRTDGTPFVATTGIHYDHWQDSKIVLVNRNTGVFALLISFPRNATTITEYRDINGRVYSYDEVAGILPKSETRETKARNRELNAARQGLDEEVPVRTYRCDRILSLRYQNEEYEVVPEAVGAVSHERGEDREETA
jgi:hypothetical protein